jgi:hypothetical protein
MVQSKKTSWALIKNLYVGSIFNIDLFVSHAWVEGVFEFEEHLLSCLTRQLPLYVCFLSNPQNLDMPKILGGGGDIKRSLFYVAPRSRTTKQVVMILRRTPSSQWSNSCRWR